MLIEATTTTTTTTNTASVFNISATSSNTGRATSSGENDHHGKGDKYVMLVS